VRDENHSRPEKGLHRHKGEISSQSSPPRSLSPMSSIPLSEKTPPGRRPALLYTFISFIALGGLVAFYCTSLFDFDSFSQSITSPIKEESLKPATTVIHFDSDTVVTVVPEEFNPDPSVISVADVLNHVPSQPIVSAIPSPSNTQISTAPDSSELSTTDIDFTDPLNITRNVFYGTSLQHTFNG
jgi:hypothetical protein